MNILNFLTCMTSKDIAFLIDSGSFLEHIQIRIFVLTTLAFTAFFTFKISKLQQIIGGASAPPAPPPAFDGPVRTNLSMAADFTFISVFVWKLWRFKEFEFIRALTVKSNVWTKFCPNFDFTVKALMSSNYS